MLNVRIRTPRLDNGDGSTRITYEIEGTPIWYESSDLILQPTPEALGSAFVIPCVFEQRALEFEQPVCDEWYANVQILVDFLHENWGTGRVHISAPGPAGRSTTASKEAAPDIKRHPAGQFFSGGVDSFHSLLTSDRPPQYLVYVEGHGVMPGKEAKIDVARRRLETVAASVGSSPCTVRTNIWEHPQIHRPYFADTHSGLLAAVAHFLAPHMASMTIPPNWAEPVHVIYGSNPVVDSMFSSRQVKVMHGDNSLKRVERVIAIAGERVVQENLRVCFDRSLQPLNCSRCEKCVRTMVELYVAGKLEDFKVFDLSNPVWERVDQLPGARRTEFFEEVLPHCQDARLLSALRRLFRRSYVDEWELRRLDPARQEFQRIKEDNVKLREGLENAMRHYELLQRDFENLAADYDEVVGRMPVKSAIRAMRKLLRFFRGKLKFG